MRRLRFIIWAGALMTAAGASVHAAVPVVESQGTRTDGTSSSSGTSVSPTPSRQTQSYPAAQSYPTVQAYPADSPPVQSYPTTAAAAAATVPAGETSQAAELFYQMQTLQVEVQELRGLVEEQRHLIERLERDQKEQYLDLDRRVSALRGASSSTASSTGGPVVGASAGAEARPAGSPATGMAPSAGASGTGERDAYTVAFNLTRDKQFQRAIDAFNQLLIDYPGGEYSGNAYYWLGELYLALPDPDLEKSRQSFAQVVTLYPNHPKVPDSLYKLGVVFHRLGDSQKALEYLDQAQRRFPGTPAARLAQSYAAEVR